MSSTTAEPWQWFPEWGPWFDGLVRQAGAWQPAPELSVDRMVVVRAVSRAAEAGAPWLYHPCLSAITHPRSEGQAERDAALAGWLAVHSSLDGELRLAAPLWCWSAGGGFLLQEGPHRLEEIGAALLGDEPVPEIPLDPWCTSLGYVHPDSWPASRQSPEIQQAGVQRSTVVALRSLALSRALLPELSAWLRSLARLLIFLDGTDQLTRSSSSAELPGILFADTTSEIALLEVMVHEAAHHLLYITEAGGPLVDPAETRRFTSPLRPDPRPLRGILLAYHALAYMCAFYAELGRSPLRDAFDPADVAHLQRARAHAGETLDAASASLTPRGIRFLDRTHEVARYAA